MKLRRTGKPLDPNKPHSPVFAAGRREWNEQVGTIAVARDNWRATALGSLAVAFIAVCGLAYSASQNHIVPYVVSRNGLNSEIAVARANVAAPADPALIESALANWITHVRTVFVDVRAQRAYITKTYAMVSAASPADAFLNAWYSKHPPFTRAATKTVSVQVQSVLPLSAHTWQVQWRETYQARNGASLPHQVFRANITITVVPPRTDAEIRANPAGIFVQSLSWQKLPVS